MINRYLNINTPTDTKFSEGRRNNGTSTAPLVRPQLDCLGHMPHRHTTTTTGRLSYKPHRQPSHVGYRTGISKPIHRTLKPLSEAYPEKGETQRVEGYAT
ncbi:hypothetical protein Taro_046885 [Colocasia esculenta]|uniref:Uncharacterized protein n=1 Tax=Colocasia esculenta TaxID=4460 RepID=A0A843WUU5_COLES|nr:hypothetical protein [Colocasia esculenta]